MKQKFLEGTHSFYTLPWVNHIEKNHVMGVLTEHIKDIFIISLQENAPPPLDSK